eukprot:2834302-Pleurochrysis_carterae.AAC.1
MDTEHTHQNVTPRRSLSELCARLQHALWLGQGHEAPREGRAEGLARRMVRHMPILMVLM